MWNQQIQSHLDDFTLLIAVNLHKNSVYLKIDMKISFTKQLNKLRTSYCFSTEINKYNAYDHFDCKQKIDVQIIID